MIVENHFTRIDGLLVKVATGYENLVVAIPCNGRENSARFDIVKMGATREYLCQLTQKEVGAWLAAYVRAHVSGLRAGAYVAAHQDEIMAEFLEVEDNQLSLF